MFAIKRLNFSTAILVYYNFEYCQKFLKRFTTFISDGMCHISFIHFRSKKNHYFDLALIREKIMKLCAILFLLSNAKIDFNSNAQSFCVLMYSCIAAQIAVL